MFPDNTPDVAIYSAKLTQEGTTAPVATIFQNNIGDIVWTRNDVGSYTGTCTGKFTQDLTSIQISNGGTTPICDVLVTALYPDTVIIYTFGIVNTPSDNVLANASIIIRVYQKQLINY